MVDHASESLRQLLLLVRFLQDRLLDVRQHAVGLRGVAGCEENLQIGQELACALHEVETAHPARHQEVGEQQIDLLVGLQDVERRGAGLGLEDAIAEPRELVGDEAAHLRLVLDKQNALIAAGGQILARLDERCRASASRAIGR